MTSTFETTPICAITGYSGYLGSQLVREFQNRGWKVLKIGRGRTDAPADFQFELGSTPIPSSWFQEQKVQVLVHAAYDLKASDPAEIESKNVQSAAALVESALQAGVHKLIHISSLSAFPGAQSLYGQSKYKVEKLFDQAGGISVRPGLIYSRQPEGIVGKMLGIMQKLPVLPLIGSGKQLQFTTHIDDLCTVVVGLASSEIAWPASRSLVFCATRAALPFREILRLAALSRSRHPIFIPVPANFIWLGLRVLERVGIRPPFRSDSVVSLVTQNQEPLNGVNLAFQDRFRPLTLASFQ